jgi:hypothetical protein
MRHPLFLMILTFIVWSGIFLSVYAMQATACSMGWETIDGATWRLSPRPVLIAIVGAGVISIAALMLRHRKTASNASEERTSVFLEGVRAYLAVAALFATGFCFVGVLWLTICSP